MKCEIDPYCVSNLGFHDSVRALIQKVNAVPHDKQEEQGIFFGTYGFICKDVCVQQIGGLSVCAGIHKIECYSDNSGPRYMRWVGNDLAAKVPEFYPGKMAWGPRNFRWAGRSFRTYFFEDSFTNCKLHGHPRDTILYAASDEQHRQVRYGRRVSVPHDPAGYGFRIIRDNPAKYLIADDDLGRAYHADGSANEPLVIKIPELAREIVEIIHKTTGSLS